ncbi:MAG: PPK2 family polyphosphate kinase, partial [Bacteroidota bacterium]
MITEEKLINVENFLAVPGQVIDLANRPTAYEGEKLNKKEAKLLLKDSKQRLAATQDTLYAHNRYNILIIFQAMDAAGKDSAIKHVIAGLNPSGVKVYSFKAPNSKELDHNYLWRHMQALPARGEIAIHNRSHYENVLVTRVHPEYILKENIPYVDSVDKIDANFWEDRFEQIKRFEKNLAQNGTIVVKFFLHLSKEEQRLRFLERIDNPEKNWKFSLSDLKERGYWEQYQQYYAEAISKTSAEEAPWFIVPADNKWYTRLVIANIICHRFGQLSVRYPIVSDKQKQKLQEARKQLVKEGGEP